MSSCTYTIVYRKYIRGNIVNRLEKIKITCLGGEDMSEEKPKLVFVDTVDIPKSNKGNRGKNWELIFNEISVGKSAIIPKSLGTGATVRIAVTALNAKLGKNVYHITQRTKGKDKEAKTTIYVSRLV